VADNQQVSSTPYEVATDKVSYSGDADRNLQLVRVVASTGAEGSKTVVENMPASLGQKVAAASFPVVWPSDADPMIVTGTVIAQLAAGEDAIGSVVVSSSALPTGAATEAELDAQTALLTTIDADTSRIPALGQAVMASSVPVVIASNQSPVPVSLDVVTTTVPIGGTVTANLSVTDNTVLDNIDTSLNAIETDAAAIEALLGTIDADTSRIPTLGQAVMASSVPVAIASNQGEVPVSGTFWQATQPVSGTVTANAGTGTQAVSLATLPALVAGSAAIGKLAANDGVDIGDVTVNSLPAPHLGMTMLSIAKVYSTTQTSADIIAGTGGQRIYVTHLNVMVGGTTAGRVSIYYGTGAFSEGTSVTLFDQEFAPSATVKPGAVLPFAIPFGGASATGDNLRITTSAGVTVRLSGQAYKA
jgi:hypothetical protein